jgi:hypothetical protein
MGMVRDYFKGAVSFLANMGLDIFSSAALTTADNSKHLN